MTARSRGLGWSLDIALAQGGFNALHPGGKGTLEQLGHDHTDFDKVFALVQSGAMLPKAWSVIAARAEQRAHHHETHGFARTASDLYLRAAVMYGRAQYSIFDAADPRKEKLRERCDFCVDRLAALRNNRVRRVELDFDGHTLFALLHLPAGEVTNAPAVILGPGMDMIKEDYIYGAERYYTSRGVVALSIEGPGQGQTRSLGLTVGLDNYERAIETYAGYLADLPEVDADRIGMFGISMSGYWALRALANPDTRLRGAATFEAVSGDFETIFEAAQPSFKANYMYMAGYTDEDAFDRDLKTRMPLGDMVTRITRPVLMGIGEFDELTPVENALAAYEKTTAPKEMRVYEGQFHPPRRRRSRGVRLRCRLDPAGHRWKVRPAGPRRTSLHARRRGRHRRLRRSAVVARGRATGARRSPIGGAGLRPRQDLRTTMQIDMTRYTAMRPYFNVIRDALTGLVDGDDFFDYFADDASIEFVITVPDYPRTVTGPEQLADLYADYGQAIVQNDSSNMHRYYDPDKSTVIIEYTIHGTLVATSRPYSNRFVSVITIGNGKITHWRDYLDPLAVIAAFTETSAPGTRGQ